MTTKLKIKDSLYILRDKKDNYVFVSTTTRRIKKFQVDSLVRDLIKSLDSEISESDLINQLSSKYKAEDISLCLQALEKEGIIRRYNENLQNDRYSKQILFIDELTNSWEETLNLQKHIKDSKIAVFGVGGIGTWIVNGLHQIGVGEISISDPDKVEESNFNRQLFFDSMDVGLYKVDVIKTKLKDANIVPFKKTINNNENLEDIISGCNFLVNCADNPSVTETTEIIDRYASKYNIPYCISGGYNLHLGMVGPIIIPNITRTFDDFIEYQKRIDTLKNLEKIRDIKQTGNLGPIAGAVANIQVMEIFKYLIGKGNVNLNKFAEINFMNFSIDWKEF